VRTAALTLTTAVAAGVSGAAPHADPNDPKVTAAAKPAAEADAAFGLRLFQKMVQEAPGKNIVYAPESVATALAMVYEGARDSTREQMGRVLALNGFANDAARQKSRAALTAALTDPDPRVTLKQANALWVDPATSLNPSFATLCRTTFGAEANTLKLRRDASGAAKRINGWVSQKTHGMIPRIVAPGDFNRDSAVVLTNAMYFKGLWFRPFEKWRTDNKPFYSSAAANGMSHSVKMMHRFDRLDYLKGPGFQGVRLPFGGPHETVDSGNRVRIVRAPGRPAPVPAKPSRFSLYVLLPDTRQGLARLISRLDTATLNHWDSLFSETQVDLSLPRLHVSYESPSDLKTPLQQLGMARPFWEGADFSKLCSWPTYIGSIKHRATVELDEQGAKAAAATAINMSDVVAGAVSPPPAMNVDHPFLFLIRDDATGAILFVGAVYRPQ